MATTIRVVSLVVLVIQNSAVILMARQSKLQEIPYYTSTIVFNQELVKMVICMVIFAFEWRALRAKRLQGDGGGGGVVDHPVRGMMPTVAAYCDELRREVFQWETVKLSVPAGLYTVQTYLQFVALSYLDAVTFQMFAQSKLLMAAVFSVLLLGKRLRYAQWASLVLLTFGVFVSQTSGLEKKKASGTTTTTISLPAGNVVVSTSESNVIMGGCACLLAGTLSAFAGVYFEKVVKTTPTSLAIRNIHLSLFATPLAGLSILLLDIIIPSWLEGSTTSTPFQFFKGYTPLVCTLVLVNALGGLLVAVVLKYADNILKGFAVAIVTVVSGLYTSIFWGVEHSWWFVGGCSLVCVATVLYQLLEIKKAHIDEVTDLFLSKTNKRLDKLV